MKRSTKQKIRETLYLRNHRLLFLLFCNPWLRFSFGLCLGILIGIPTVTTKFVLSTEKGFKPEIRVSLLDKLQAYALAHSARTATTQSSSNLAIESWRRAIGNHPGRADYNQEYLKTLVLLDEGRKRWKDALTTSRWLLHLTRTNQLSIAWAARALEHYQLDHTLITLAERQSEPRNATTQHAYLKALFRLGHHEAFKDQWNATDVDFKNDPDLELYQAAFNAMTDPNRTESQGNQQLQNALETQTSRLLAQKLLLHVAHRWTDSERFLEYFNALRGEFADELNDHVLLWDLLTRTGKQAEARQAAQRYVNPPKTGHQVVHLADAYAKLDLPEAALHCLQNYRMEHGFLDQKQYTLAILLISQQRWLELQRFAISIRRQKGSSGPMLAFSYFLGGLSAHEQARHDDAKREFDSIRHYSFHDSDLSLYVGANLWRLNFPEHAHSVLWKERGRYANHPSYWQLVFDITSALQLPAQMLQATSNLHRLVPDSVSHRLNFASLLISQRQQLDRAQALTFEVLVKHPKNTSALVNYAQALALCERTDEATTVLAQISLDPLTARQKQGYLFAKMIIHAQNRDYEQAHQTSQDIIPELLLPGDRAFYGSILARCHGQITKVPSGSAETVIPPRKAPFRDNSAVKSASKK